MYQHTRSLLFQLDPEQAHDLTLSLLRLSGRGRPLRSVLKKYFQAKKSRPVNLLGLRFPNPVGMAAGYDKDGTAWPGLAALGFGHIELGTVTPKPQAGNPKPRIFRLPAEQALINRMGFPGKGAEFLHQQLLDQADQRNEKGLILGLNIGKNRSTPNQLAAEDYLQLLEKFFGLVDYIAVNVSSPNTIGLRNLQNRDHLERLVTRLVDKRDQLTAGSNQPLPLLIKLSPDLSSAELDDALEALDSGGADGVIATNTTTSRAGLDGPVSCQEGGLSGAPLRERSTAIIKEISQRTGGRLPIIGVGGIDSADDALEKLDAGADLVQIYTGLVYQGPGLVKTLIEALS